MPSISSQEMPFEDGQQPLAESPAVMDLTGSSTPASLSSPSGSFPNTQVQQESPIPTACTAVVALETPEKQANPWTYGPGETRAIQAYAQAKSMDPSKVDLGMVNLSPEGLLYWSNQGQNFGGRSNSYQCFHRAIKHDEFAKKVYPALDEPLKLEMRQRWSLRNNFQFTAEKKIITISHGKREEDIGEYMTEEQIAVELGLGGFPSECDQSLAKSIPMGPR